MEPHSVIYPPNRQMEKEANLNNFPVIFDYFMFLDINDQGKMILGTSNICGTYWNGTLFCYEKPESVLTDFYGYYNTIASISCGKFIQNSNNVVIAEDDKFLKFLTLLQNDGNIQCEDYCLTQERINEISIGKNSNKLIYTCLGNTVAVWDVENNSGLSFVKKYKSIHSDVVTSIDTSYHYVNLLVSSSVDRKCCIWDDRVENPASVIYSNEFSSLTSVAWHPEYSHLLVVGSAAGDVYLLDKRQPREFIVKNNCMDNKIFRMSFNKQNYLAICGDVPHIQVYKCTDTNITNIYNSYEHKDVVRGLSWYEDVLYSCGFDKKITKHIIDA